jgi:hypothetical protein
MADQASELAGSISLRVIFGRVTASPRGTCDSTTPPGQTGRSWAVNYLTSPADLVSSLLTRSHSSRRSMK